MIFGQGWLLKQDKEQDMNWKRRGDRKRERSIHKGWLGACEPWQHGLKPPKRNTPLQWQIQLIRDDPRKPISVLTAWERPWPWPTGCITAGKRSCQGQAGHRLSTMPLAWRHTDRTPFFHPSRHRPVHSEHTQASLWHNLILRCSMSTDRCWN